MSERNYYELVASNYCTLLYNVNKKYVLEYIPYIHYIIIIMNKK